MQSRLTASVFAFAVKSEPAASARDFLDTKSIRAFTLSGSKTRKFFQDSP